MARSSADPPFFVRRDVPALSSLAVEREYRKALDEAMKSHHAQRAVVATRLANVSKHAGDGLGRKVVVLDEDLFVSMASFYLSHYVRHEGQQIW